MPTIGSASASTAFRGGCSWAPSTTTARRSSTLSLPQVRRYGPDTLLARPLVNPRGEVAITPRAPQESRVPSLWWILASRSISLAVAPRALKRATASPWGRARPTRRGSNIAERSRAARAVPRKATRYRRRPWPSSRRWNLHREPPVVPGGPTRRRGAPFGALVSIFAPFCFGTRYLAWIRTFPPPIVTGFVRVPSCLTILLLLFRTTIA